MKLDFDIPDYVKELKELCDRNSVKLYLVGGAVRDILLKRQIADYDFLVEGKLENIANIFSLKINKKFLVYKKKITVYRFFCQSYTIDLLEVKPNTLEDELRRRDFTINAMAIDLNNNALIDPLNGLNDIKSHVVRATHENIFKDDPIRIIRLFRIAAQFKFDIEKNTLDLARQSIHLLSSVAYDRITQELEKFFLINDTFSYVLLMDRIGLIDGLFEDLSYENGCMQSSSHLYDVKSHSLSVYNFVEWSILRMKRIVGEECFDKYYSYYTANRKQIIIALKLAALFHDCSKPFVKQINDSEISFKNHEIHSAEIFKKYAKMYNFSSKISRLTIFLILNHIEPAHLFLKWKNNALNEELLYDFFDKFKIHGVDLLIFALSDTLAKGKIKMVNREIFIEFLKDMVCFYFERYVNFESIPMAIQVSDLKKIGIKDSELSKVIRSIRKNTFLQKIKTKDDALAFAKLFLNS